MALAIYSIFLIFSLLGRVLLQYRLTGDHGLRLSSPSSNAARFSNLLLAIAFMVTFGLCVMEALGKIQPWLMLGSLSRIGGSILGLSAVMLTLFSQIQMGSSWRIGVDESESTELVTTGIYAKIRNPIYTGVMLFGLSLGVLLPHPIMAAALALGYLGIEMQVRRVEEPYLRRRHGAAFATYTATTGRYFPRLF